MDSPESRSYGYEHAEGRANELGLALTEITAAYTDGLVRLAELETELATLLELESTADGDELAAVPPRFIENAKRRIEQTKDLLQKMSALRQDFEHKHETVQSLGVELDVVTSEYLKDLGKQHGQN